jgi:hypothetical protein
VLPLLRRSQEKGRMLLYKLGRFLQVVGMILLPIGIAGNVADPQRIDLKTSLTISGVGVLVFIVGYMIQQAGRPK